MIAEFKVKNYLSFKKEQILSFEATSDKYLQDYHCIKQENGERLLRFAIIYGANASGKTNLLLALDFLRNLIIKPKLRDQETGFVPFEFDEESKHSPGFFEISMFINNVKYVYSIELDHKIIYTEKLVFYPGTQPAIVFHRQYNKNTGDYSIKTGSRVKIDTYELAALKSNTLNNMTIVSGFSKTYIKFKELNEFYNRIKNNLSSIIRPWSHLYKDAINEISTGTEEYKNFVLENLDVADFNIKDINVHFQGIATENENNNYSDMQVSDSYERYGKEEVVFTHDIAGTKKNLSVNYQSSGTLRYLGLIGLMQKALKKSMMLNIDELENSLHPDLINHLINTFLYYSKKENSQAQFIFTTHNINLLAEDFIRKDIVWFSEKDEDGSTRLFSLDDFDIRKNLSFFNAYKAGKFGAVPNIGIL